MVISLGDVVSEYPKDTIKSLAKVEWLPNYTSSNPLAHIQYNASGMLLYIALISSSSILVQKNNMVVQCVSFLEVLFSIVAYFMHVSLFSWTIDWAMVPSVNALEWVLNIVSHLSCYNICLNLPTYFTDGDEFYHGLW